MNEDRQLQNVLSVDDYAAWLRERGCSVRTIEEYTRRVRQFLRKFATHDVDEFKQRHAIKFIRDHQNVGQESHSQDAKSIVSLWRYMYAEGIVATEDVLEGWRPRAARWQTPKGYVKQDEIDAMLENDELTERERAVVQFLRETGCRANAAGQMLTVDYYEDSEGVPHVRFLQEKAGQRIKREFQISGYLRGLLNAHLGIRPYPNKWLWQCHWSRRSGTPWRGLITSIIRSAVLKTFGRKSEQAHRVTPHGFRYAFAQAVDRNGASLGEIQNLLGHARASTTEKYLRVHSEQAREAHRKYLERFAPAESPDEVIFPKKTEYAKYRYLLFAVERHQDGTLGDAQTMLAWEKLGSALKGFKRVVDHAEGRLEKLPTVAGTEVHLPRATVLLVLMDMSAREQVRIWQRNGSDDE